MTLIIATLCLCLGLYFTAATGSGIVLRTAGHTPLYKVLEVVAAYLPYVSTAILILVETIAFLKHLIPQPRILVVKLPIMLLIAVTPFAIYVAMYGLTYAAGPIPHPKMLGPLSILEWSLFLVGCVLITVSLFLFVVKSKTGVASGG